MNRARTRILACVVGVALGLTALHGAAFADDASNEALFHEGTSALEAGRPESAIAAFEALGDRGVTDPVVSFDRGLAYAQRVHAGGQVAGDLGRAVHGFEEARALTNDPALEADATRALTEVRAEIARRRARAGNPIELEHGASLGRAIVRVLPENAWALLTLAASIVLSVGIVLRAKARASRAKVAATTTCAIAGAVSCIALAATLIARDFRLHVREGIVVVDNTRVLDPRHVAISSVEPLAEGTRVRILDDGTEFVKIETGSARGDVSVSSILPLAKP